MKTIQIKLKDIEPEDRAFLLLSAISGGVMGYIGTVDGAMEQMNVAPAGAVVLVTVSYPVALILDVNKSNAIITKEYRKIVKKYAPDEIEDTFNLEIVEG